MSDKMNLMVLGVLATLLSVFLSGCVSGGDVCTSKQCKIKNPEKEGVVKIWWAPELRNDNNEFSILTRG